MLLVSDLEAAHARPLHGGVEAQPERVPVHGVRDVEDRIDRAVPELVALPAELEGIDWHLDVEAPSLA